MIDSDEETEEECKRNSLEQQAQIPLTSPNFAQAKMNLTEEPNFLNSLEDREQSVEEERT